MSQVLPASAGRSTTTPSERERLEDIGFMTCMTLVLLGNYAQTGHFGGPLGVHAVQRGHAPGGPGLGRPSLRLPATEASLLRQVHAGRRPLRADLLRALDDHGRGAVSPAPGDRRPALSRGARRRDAVGRRARLPARRRRAQDAARGPGARRPSAVRAGEGARHPRALRAHRIDRRDERRQRRAVGHRHRHRGRQGRVLGHRRRARRDRRRSSPSRASSRCAPATRRS